MTALAADRKVISKWTGRSLAIKVAASTLIYKGALVAVNTSGYAVAAAATAGYRVVGVAQRQVDNSAGAAGDLEVQVLTGVFAFKNDADAIAQADIGRPCFVQDDQTVQDENGGSPIVAGIVDSFDSSWVYVNVSPEASMAGGQQFSGIETVTSGALSLYTRTSLVSVTGTQAYTLAAGLFEGQRKTVRVTVAASTPDGTLTPTAFASGTSLDLDAVNECVELEYHDTGGWNVVFITGATIN
jgi:hypothetical protein